MLLLLLLVTGSLNDLYILCENLGNTQVNKRNTGVKYETCLMLLRY